MCLKVADDPAWKLKRKILTPDADGDERTDRGNGGGIK